MPNNQPTSYDIFKFAVDLSSLSPVVYSRAETSSMCAAAKQEEMATSADRSRKALSTLISLNYLDLLSEESSIAHDAAALGALIVEMVLRLSSPSSVILSPFAYRGLNPQHQSYEKYNINTVHVINAPNLDYAERHLGIEISDEHVVSMQSIKNNSVGRTYDMAIVYFETIFYDEDLLQNTYNLVSPGGTLVLMGTADNGTFYVQQEAHPFHKPHQTLKNMSGANLFFFPVGVGYTIIHKEPSV